MQREFAQLKILDPLFRVGSSRPQRMHNGLPLSLLDFLLVTAMLLVTPTDEWMNVTRTGPSEPFTDPGQPSSTTGLDNSHSLDIQPSYDAVSPETPEVEATSEATPAIERWRSGIPPRAREDSQSQYGDSVDNRSSSTASRATSRLSFHTDMQSATHNSSNPSPQVVYATQSSSSLSLASRSLSSSQPTRRKTRELPIPPLPSPHGYVYDRGPLSASAHILHMPHVTHSRPLQNELPPIPSLPSSSSISQQDPPRLPVMSPIIVPSRCVTTSPASSIHSRSLPIPPTPSRPKARLPSLPLLPLPPTSAVALLPPSPLPSPVPSVPQHSLLSRSRSYSHLQNAAAYPGSPHEYESRAKAPPNYDSSPRGDPPLPIRAHVPTHRPGGGRSLSICTATVVPAPSAASASTSSTTTSLASEEGGSYDMPPAYSVLDMARSPLRLCAANGDMGDE
jgi:hypothetical protein